jgi:RNA polymerase primary sigma factor
MRKAERHLAETLGRDPAADELAHYLGVSERVVGHWQTVSMRPTSLDAPIGNDEGADFNEIIGDDRAVNPFDEMNNQQLRVESEAMLDRLDKRERDILKYRFGLCGVKEETLEDVGARFKITRERVRQIQNAALTKLRGMMEENAEVHERTD